MLITESSRLSLRGFTNDDADFVYRIVNSPGWLRFIGDRGVKDLETARGYIDRNVKNYEALGFGLYVVVLKETNEAIGIAGLVKRDYLPVADIGYAILPEFEGKGLAVESARAVLDYARQLKMDRLLAIVTPNNSRSIVLLDKLGFVFDKEITQNNKPLLVYAWDALK